MRPVIAILLLLVVLRQAHLARILLADGVTRSTGDLRFTNGVERRQLAFLEKAVHRLPYVTESSGVPACPGKRAGQVRPVILERVLNVLARVDLLEAPGGVEPSFAGLQPTPLPLGYGALLHVLADSVLISPYFDPDAVPRDATFSRSPSHPCWPTYRRILKKCRSANKSIWSKKSAVWYPDCVNGEARQKELRIKRRLQRGLQDAGRSRIRVLQFRRYDAVSINKPCVNL